VAGAVSIVVVGRRERGADVGRVGVVAALRAAWSAVWRGTLGGDDGEAAWSGGGYASPRHPRKVKRGAKTGSWHPFHSRYINVHEISWPSTKTRGIGRV